MLSEKVKELIAKAKIMGVANWRDTHSETMMQLLQRADDESRYLTDDDLSEIGRLMPERVEGTEVVKLLRDRVQEIVDEARAGVLAVFPKIMQPGGGLYPAMRAEACWRDFWHFLRCITYGIAAGRVDYTNPEGLHYMELLYEELKVPLDAMVVGLEGIKVAALKRVAAEQGEAIGPYFDHLIGEMKKF
jgi:hypothetical protein